ncbi:MAG TPA: peptide ABC transporter permease [Verrucomicrobiales bacterium]|nr:peptide ABC transporter permease [Verrucomicrobiales bacterium]
MTATNLAVASGPEIRGRSLWADARTRFFRNKAAVTSLVIFVLIVFACYVVPYLGLRAPDDLGNYESWGAPDLESGYLLGTDANGRDLFVRTLYGGQISLLVGFTATMVSLVIGVIWGATAGFIGGRVDGFMMRIVDILYSMPFIFFVILLMVFFGRNIILLFVAIGAVEWLTMARIVRGQVMSLRRQEFIEACLSLGLSRRRIILRHMIPNVLGPIAVYTTLTIPAVMLLEAFLSFLGLGVQPPMSSWGLLIKEGAEMMEEAPWLLIYPGLLFSLTLFSLNFLGDGLRDALDPKASKD